MDIETHGIFGIGKELEWLAIGRPNWLRKMENGKGNGMA